jgi:hypothetical protein
MHLANWAQIREAVFLSIIGCSLVLSGMLGAGSAARIARAQVAESARRRLVGAALTLWLAASAGVVAVASRMAQAAALPMAAGGLLALLRLAVALGFDLRAARPRGGDFSLLVQSGVKPLIAAAAFAPIALLGLSIPAALACGAMLLAADVFAHRDETQKKRAAGRLTALLFVLAAPLLLLPTRAFALGALVASYLLGVVLSAGPGALLHLPSALYEAYLPVRARIIRRRASR